MNISIIKKAIEFGSDDETIKNLIIREIAIDEDAVPMILEIINTERHLNKELILDMNLELSRLHIQFETPKFAGKNKIEQQQTVKDNVKGFYEKWKGKIGHCFIPNYTRKGL